MKNYITLIVSFFLIFIKSQIDELKQYKYEAIYNYKSFSDSLKDNFIEQKMALYIGNNESLYQSLYKKSIDSMLKVKNIGEASSFIDLSKIKLPKSTNTITKKYIDNTLIFTDRIGNLNVGYKDNFDDLKWQITNERKKILTYNATKATLNFRGRNYIAWFTDEIPFQDGPYKFAKLPGLILEIFDSKNYFHYSLLSFKKIENNVWYNPKFVEIERKSYYQKKVDYHNSLVGNPIYNGKVKRADSYNPIELK